MLRDSLPADRMPRPQLMGILNVTPDSFSDGGQFLAPDRALAQARRLVEDGADILDVGAESTRPGHTPIAAELELQRLLPVLDALPAALAGRAVPISVDTTKATVAAAALARGATIVNDIWGFHGDPALPGTVAAAGARAVLMHNRHTVDAALDIVDDMLRFFERSLANAEAAGVPRERLILDPGIGFGKSQPQQLQALAGIGRLGSAFGLPILVGASRKSFLKPYAGDGTAGRLAGTLAAHLAAARAGAAILRVHDVVEHAAALGVDAAITAAARTAAAS